MLVIRLRQSAQFEMQTLFESQRLRYVPLSPEDLRALIDGVPQFEAGSGLQAAAGLRDGIVSDEVSPKFLELLQISEDPDPWVFGFALVLRDCPLAIGTAGFKGPPNNAGVVEIAYGLVPGYQGQGLGTEAAQALLQFAWNDRRVTLVCSHTLPEPSASTRVLTKCGFRCIGEVVDPEDGAVWRWELPRTA